MTEIRTVTTLVRKRDEIRASIRMYEAKIGQARSDLSHVTAVLRLFEASGRGQDLARYMDSYRLFKRGEPWAICAAAECEVTYTELPKRLKKHGLKETEASITNKLK